MFHSWMIGSGLAFSAGAAVYSVVALAAVFTRSRPVDAALRPTAAAKLPSVTIFKPLCGAEPETYECLRSFCDQDYPEFQVVFGVADVNDPVVPIIERLQAEFPARDLQLVVDRRQHGTSRKVSNLVNMLPAARHDYFVIADSDVRVERDYLSRIVAPLEDEAVGIVTCAYRGVPRSGVWSLLGSQFINEWFIPSVRVAALGGSRAFAFGVTIAMSRRVLCRIGGFMAIVNQLADDYRLGELTRNLGLRTVLSDVVVETFVAESSLAELVGEGAAVVHKRFTAGDNGHAAGVGGSGSYQFGYGITGVAAGLPAIFDVAPDATDVAAAQSDEPGGLSLMEAFPLEGVELFHDREGG